MFTLGSKVHLFTLHIFSTEAFQSAFLELEEIQTKQKEAKGKHYSKSTIIT